jgi:hypothetical protein
MDTLELARLMASAEDIKCECGCIYFEKVDSFKRISKIMAATAKDVILSKPVLVCKKCMKENQYLMELLSDTE